MLQFRIMHAVYFACMGVGRTVGVFLFLFFFSLSLYWGQHLQSLSWDWAAEDKLLISQSGKGTLTDGCQRSNTALASANNSILFPFLLFPLWHRSIPAICLKASCLWNYGEENIEKVQEWHVVTRERMFLMRVLNIEQELSFIRLNYCLCFVMPCGLFREETSKSISRLTFHSSKTPESFHLLRDMRHFINKRTSIQV